MSQLEDKIALYKEFAEKNGIDIDGGLLAKVTKGLGPTIYSKDSELISCSKKSELEHVRESFLKKKLGLSLSDEILDAVLSEICAEIGSSVKTKYRAVFYTMLVEKLNKSDIYE